MSLLTRGRDAVDVGAVCAALSAVLDPEIGRSLGALGTLADVRVDRRGRVEAAVLLTTPNSPVVDLLGARVTEAAMAVAGVTEVEVKFGDLGARERAELAADLRRTNVDLTSGLGTRTRIYAVASGKGGVGKSTVTANLAVALAATGLKVGVLDADVWGYSIPGLFGVTGNPVVVSGLMLPVQAHGVSLMSMGFLVPDGAPVVWRGPMLHKALEQFLVDVHWGADLDVLLLDLPPGTGDVQLSLLELVPNAALLAVTTPQPAAQGVAQRVVTMAREASMPVAGVVENMSALACDSCGQHTDLFGSGGGDLLAQAAQAPLLGRIPLDRALRVAGDAGTPVVLAEPDAHSARALTQIAAALPVVRRSLAGRSLPLTPI